MVQSFFIFQLIRSKMFTKTFFSIPQNLLRWLGWVALLTLSAPTFAINIQHWQVAGAGVYFVSAPEIPMVDIQLTIKSGSAADPRDQAGLAAMTQSQLMLANRRYSEKKLSDFFANYGAVRGSSVSADASNFQLRLTNEPETMAAILPVWLDLLQNPHFQTALFNRERARAIADYRESLTLPAPVANRAFFEALYGDHPYGYPTTDQSLLAIKIPHMLRFYRTHYSRENAQVILVGALSRAQAESIAEQIIRALPAQGQSAPTQAPPANANRFQTINIPFQSQQTHILAGMPLINRQDPDLFPLLVGNYILGGGGFESRLTKVIRVENGFAYSVYSTFVPLRDRGAWWINMQTRADQTQAALNLLQKTVIDFVRQGPSARELADAQKFLVSSYPLRFDSNRKILEQVSMVALYDLPLDYLDTWTQKVSAVTREDIVQAFTRKFSISAENPEAMDWWVLTLGQHR